MKIFSTLLSIFIFSCQNSLDVDTAKHTASDPIADITFLNGYFYTTNLDNSGNAGHQIDLFKFDSLSNPVNLFELPLNGQGYMAAANDGNNLYFQPRYKWLQKLIFFFSSIKFIFLCLFLKLQ